MTNGSNRKGVRKEDGGRSSSVLKTVSRVKDNVSTPSVGRAAVVALLSGAICSFAVCTGGLYAWMVQDQQRQAEMQAVLAMQVPAVLFAMPVAAFAGVLLLNALNLPHSVHHDTRFKSNLSLFFVVAVACVTDMLIFVRLTPIAMAGNGRLIHPIRYIQWSHSTPMMIYMLSLMSDLSSGQVVTAMVNDVSMILTGLASTMCSSLELRVAWGAASFVNFAVVLFYLIKMVTSAAKESTDPHSKGALKTMLAVTLVLWSSYPAAWMLAELRMISPAMEQFLWGILDYMAKAVFTSQMWQANIKTVEERRAQALQAWENSNRVMVVDKLQALVGAKEQMLRIMSHELRTPLLGIMAMSSTLLKDDRHLSHKERVKQLSMVRACASCLVNLVNATLETSGANGHQQEGSEAQLAAVQLRPLVREIFSLIKPLAHGGVDLLNEVPSALAVVGSRAKLSQVLFNLIGNAARFTHAGHIKVGATLSSDPSLVEVTVSDTGVGMPQNKLEVIFQPYERTGDDIVEAYGGNGLGLYLVKLSLISCGSEVSVVSEVGSGTTFSFPLKLAEKDAGLAEEEDAPGSAGGSQNPSERVSLESDTERVDGGAPAAASPDDGLPLPDSAPAAASSDDGPMLQGSAAAAVPPAASASTSAAAAGASTRLHAPNRLNNNTLQIMSVDDDIINQVVAEQVLKREKWQVVKAFDGLQALEYIETKSRVLPDLVLLDIMMPNMDGYELCAKLRERYPSALLPIIMVSAKAREEDIVKALKNGADDYITKPYKRAELVERIRAHLRARDTGRDFEVMATLAGALAEGTEEAGQEDEPEPDVLSSLQQGLTVCQASCMAVLSVRVLGLEQQLCGYGECSTSTGEASHGVGREEPTANGTTHLLAQSENSRLAASPDEASRQHNIGSTGQHAAPASSVVQRPRVQGLLSAFQGAKEALQKVIMDAYCRHEELLSDSAGLCSSASDLAHPASGCADDADAQISVSAVVGPAASSDAAGCCLSSLSHDTFAALMPLSRPCTMAEQARVSSILEALVAAAAGLRWPDGSPMLVQSVLHCCPVRFLRSSSPAQYTGGTSKCQAALGSGTETGAAVVEQDALSFVHGSSNPQQQQQSDCLQWAPCTLLSPSPAALQSLAGCSPAGCMLLTSTAHANLAAGGGDCLVNGNIMAKQQPQCFPTCQPWGAPSPEGAPSQGMASTPLLAGPIGQLYIAEIGGFADALSAGPSSAHAAAAVAACALGLLTFHAAGGDDDDCLQ